MPERQLASLCVLSARFTFLFSIYPSDDDRTEVSEAYESTVFENPSKCRIFKNSPKLTVFWHFSTQNVSIASDHSSTTAYGPLLRVSGRTPLLRLFIHFNA